MILGRCHPCIVFKLQRKILIRRVTEQVCDLRIIVMVLADQFFRCFYFQSCKVFHDTAAFFLVKNILQVRASDHIIFADLHDRQMLGNVLV